VPKNVWRTTPRYHVDADTIRRRRDPPCPIVAYLVAVHIASDLRAFAKPWRLSRAILQTILVAQVLSGWRLLAVTTYVAGLILLDHGASLLRLSRYLPGASHDQLTRLLGERDLPALLMAALRSLARALTHLLGTPIWISDDLIVPKPASATLAWAKGLWCPSERRYVRAITIVVLLASWGALRMALGFRVWCPKECAPPQLYRTKLDLAVDLLAEARRERVGCHYLVFDSWYTARPLTSYLDMHGLIWHAALAANHEIVWHGQPQRVDGLGRQLHDWYARLSRLCAGQRRDLQSGIGAGAADAGADRAAAASASVPGHQPDHLQALSGVAVQAEPLARGRTVSRGCATRQLGGLSIAAAGGSENRYCLGACRVGGAPISASSPVTDGGAGAASARPHRLGTPNRI
jgi:DDE superfamily endonuclease